MSSVVHNDANEQLPVYVIRAQGEWYKKMFILGGPRYKYVSQVAKNGKDILT